MLRTRAGFVRDDSRDKFEAGGENKRGEQQNGLEQAGERRRVESKL